MMRAEGAPTFAGALSGDGHTWSRRTVRNRSASATVEKSMSKLTLCSSPAAWKMRWRRAPWRPRAPAILTEGCPPQVVVLHLEIDPQGRHGFHPFGCSASVVNTLLL